MRANRKLVMLAVSLVAFFLFSFGCQKKAEAGPTAPGFSLKDLSGNITSLEQYRGHIVILDFWATWCGPCVMAIPELVKLQEKYKEKGVVVLGISMDDPQQANDEHLLSFKKRYKINYKILRYDKKVMNDYFKDEIPAIPAAFLIDSEMKIRDKILGYRPGVLEKSLIRVLE